MSVQELLRGYFVAGLAAGVAGGLALGLVAHRNPSADAYGSFPRRATRLGHVASVALPAIAAAHASLLDVRCGAPALAQLAAVLWIAGGVLLPAALFVAAARPRLVLAVPVPALAIVASAALFALSWMTGGPS